MRGPRREQTYGERAEDDRDQVAWQDAQHTFAQEI